MEANKMKNTENTERRAFFDKDEKQMFKRAAVACAVILVFGSGLRLGNHIGYNRGYVEGQNHPIVAEHMLTAEEISPGYNSQRASNATYRSGINHFVGNHK